MCALSVKNLGVSFVLEVSTSSQPLNCFFPLFCRGEEHSRTFTQDLVPQKFLEKCINYKFVIGKVKDWKVHF